MSSKGDRLVGKVAIVTGGGSGFGAATATLFAAQGCRVLVGDINMDGAQKTANVDSHNMHAMKVDVTSKSDWEAALKEVLNRWGHIDIVINNAGTTYKNKFGVVHPDEPFSIQPTLDVTEDEFDRCFRVNVKSVYHSIAVMVPKMIDQKNGGAVINVASIGAMRPRPGLVWYNSSKGAVANATKGLAAEYGPHQIRVNSVCPLLSGTGLFEYFAGVPDTTENRAKFISNVPLGRLTEPADVANTLLFLSSDEGKFITGVNLEVDGGRAV